MKFFQAYRFFHRALIAVLQEGCTSVDNQKESPLTEEQYNLVKGGFCFSLVVDWLYSLDRAQKFYWDTGVKDSEGLGAKKYVSQTMNHDRYQYYFGLAEKFCDYCTAVKDPFEKNKVAIEFVFDGKTVIPEFVANCATVFSYNNAYLAKHGYKGARFCSGGEWYLTPKMVSEQRKEGSKYADVPKEECLDKMRYDSFAAMIEALNNLTGNYSILLNLFLYYPGGKASERMLRHSIGIQKMKKDGKMYYIIFDPTYGVLVTDAPRTGLYKKLIKGQYETQSERLGQKLVGHQYYLLLKG